MILKILNRKGPSYGSLIRYLITNRETEKIIAFGHNLRSLDPALAIQEFLENESYRKNRRTNNTYYTHNILSWSDLDAEKITPEMLLTMAREFISLRGDTGLFFGTVHLDTDSPHVHLMCSGTEMYTGKAMRMSHAKLKEIKSQLQDFQISHFPELVNSICDFEKNKEYSNNQQFNKTKRQMKTEITSIIKSCLERANTQKEFLELLRENNLDHYERKMGEPTGIIIGDQKFRFSRLDIDLEKLHSLPLDISEEQKALSEIQSIRERRDERTHDRMLRFEENSKPKALTYFENSNILDVSSWYDDNGNFHTREIEELNHKEPWDLNELGDDNSNNDLPEFEEPER